MIWVGHLTAFAVLLQSLELRAVKAWPLVDQEVSPMLRPLLRVYRGALDVRLLAAVVAIFYPSALLVGLLLLTSWIVAMRWRGVFNGASDSMTMWLLLAWLISLAAPGLEPGCTRFVAGLAALSYFVAGVSKLVQPGWRDGSTLRWFLSESPLVYSSGTARQIASSKPVSRLMSWAAIVFECSFPVALVYPVLTLPYLAAGVLFHFACFYFFGLNRFFWIWLAAYPAIYH